MSNLLELAIDLINDAKSGRDAQGKLFLLEQVKEICFHRDKSVLKDIIPSILDFMVEKSVSIKKYLVKFVEDAMGQEPQLSFPYYLNLLSFLLSDANDSVLSLMVKSFQKFYDIILINIVSMPVAAKAQGLSDPKQLWQMFSTLTTRFNEFIGTNKSDAVKINCLRLYESQMLFGLPSPAPTTSDPRLARKDPRLARAGKAGPTATTNAPGGASTGKNAEEIPLHHSFISRNEIQQSAEDCFQRVLLWSSKNGTQSHPFSPAMMSILGQVIANVASSRLKHASTAAKALVTMIQSKSNVAQEMSGGDRGNLARAIHRLLRSATAYTADPDGMMPKLRAAVTNLEALGLDVADEARASATVLKKRGRGAATVAESSSVSTPGVEDDESEEATMQRRSSAVAAIDAAEEKMKSLSVFPDLTGDGGDDAIAMLLATVSSSTKTAPKSTVGLGGMLISGDVTELAKDLSIEDDAGSVSTLKLVNTVSEKLVGATAATTIQHVLHQTSENYGALALCSMQKLLESFNAIEQTNTKMLKPFSIMCVKTVLSIALSEVETRAAYVPVQILSIIPTSMAGKLAADAPTHVTLPRSLWIFLGFVLTSPAPQGDTSTRDERWEEELQKKVAILSQVCLALNEEIAWLEEENAEEAAAEEQLEFINSLRTVYDALVIAAMSRMIQTPQLRSSLSAYMIGLPAIPAQCIGLLKLLFATGTKSSTSSTGAGGTGRDRHAMAIEAARNRGTRSEATSLLAHLVFSQDETAGRDSLYHLLYSCLSDDFETRTKVVNLIISDIVHLEDWCDEMVTRFALQAMIGAVGPEAVQAWCAQLPAEDKEEDGKEQQQTREEESMAVEVAAEDSAMEGVEEGVSHTTAVAAGTSPRHCSFRSACREFFADELTRVSFPVVAPAEREAYSKKAVQLLSQLCLVDISMLTAFTQLYSAWCVGSSQQGPADKTTTTNTVKSECVEASAEELTATTAGAEEVKEDKENAAEEPNVIVPETGGKSATAWTLAETLKSELRNILPAIAQNHTIEKVFETMAQDQDARVRPLLEYVLNILLADYTVPPTSSLIEKVRAFALLTEENNVSKNETHEMDVEREEQDKNTTGSSIKTDTTATTTAASTEVENTSILYDLQHTQNFTLMLPLVGGMSAKEIERCLPRILALYAVESPDALKVTFTRITRARPPPLTKATLLIALHRIDFESHNMKAKTILDAIAVCLNNKSEYSGEVVKEALRTMLPDDPPPYALMRTAILSAQSFSEVKRYVLSDIIPQLVRRMVWTTAPKLWEGVVYGAKNLAASGFKNSEYTLRALLGVPVAQLKSLLRVAPTVKTAMGKLLKTLSIEEKDEVISGKWAGLTTTEEGDSNTTITNVSEEKQKLIKDIAASVTL